MAQDAAGSPTTRRLPRRLRHRRRRDRRSWCAAARASMTPASTSASPASRPTGWPPSSTRPAPRGGRRAVRSPTATCGRTWRRTSTRCGRCSSPDEVGLVFLPMAHTLTKIIALVGMECGMKLAFATASPISRRSCCSCDRRWSWRSRGCSRRSSTARSTRPGRRARHALRQGDRRGHPLVRAPRTGRLPPDHEPRARRAGAAGVPQAASGVRGRLRFAVSGGGPLGERLTHFFDGIGVKIFEGYGLTETSPTLTVNRVDAWKPGTVGTPLAGTSIRIADDGEILAKGPQVFQGYWRNEAATADDVRRRGLVLDRRRRRDRP